MHFCLICSVIYTRFSDVSHTPQRMGNGSGLPVNFFFWRRLDERDQSVTHAQTKQLQAQVPVITDHFRGGSRRTVRTLSTPTLHQRQRESFGSTACEEGRPAVHPCLLDATLAHLVPWAKCKTKAADSSDHLPPTSALRTTSLVRPFRP